ncbi:MAG: hypothetical protein U9N85_10210 [Bacteroidota bacterium]|nr:hypothetical protein [Bacteroidota bacterium]
MDKQKLKQKAKSKTEDCRKIINGLNHKIKFLALGRFLIFTTAIIVFFVFDNISLIYLTGIEVLFVIAFFMLVTISYKKRKQLRFYNELLLINTEWISTLNEDYSPFHSGNEMMDTTHDFSYDIDLFGNTSIFQLLNRTVTLGGKLRLSAKISHLELEPEIIQNQQTAINELSDDPEFRQNFSATGRINNHEPHIYKNETKNILLKNLLKWTNEPHILQNKVWVKYILFIFPFLTILSGILSIAGLVSSGAFVLLFLLQLGIVGAFTKKVSEAHHMLSKKNKSIAQISVLVDIISEKTFNSTYLKRFQAVLNGEKMSAVGPLKKMKSLLKAFDARLNFIVGLVANALLMWDLQILFRLEKLKSELSEGLAVWFDALSEFDALISLADFAYSNPDFVYPKTANTDFTLDIRNGAHPLLPSTNRVGNNFSASGLGKMHIVTGANMAGKSTFLRTIAVNMILASAGTKVCAEYMKWSPVNIYTSVRTTDSIQKHESYFYAELMRLKKMTERLKAGEKLFVILDEMLKGTNSDDKHKGSEGLLEQLIQYKTAGLAATHDTQLGKLADKYPEKIINKRFEATIENEELSFDYQLQDGISRNLNAVFLMKKYGIIPESKSYT